MRFLAHNGLFAIVKDDGEGENEAYDLTPASYLLVEGPNHCLSPIVMLTINPRLFDANLKMGEWIFGEDEKSLYENAFGVSLWDLMHKNPQLVSSFHDAMSSDSEMVNLALSDCNEVFCGLETVVDVGGGKGVTGKVITDAFPGLKYIVLDQPHVANLIGTDNLSFVGGDMFQSVPDADAVLLKWILHDWSDIDCKRILKNCKDAVTRKGKGGKLMIIEMVINEKEEKEEITETKLLFDIHLMTINGKERSEKEWKQLFLESGFQQYKIFPLFGLRSLIELYV